MERPRDKTDGKWMWRVLAVLAALQLYLLRELLGGVLRWLAGALCLIAS